MPVLKNAKHEAYCQHRAAGKNKSDSYVAAGFTINRANAVRLDAKPDIQKRVAELLEEAARATQQALQYDALSIFKRIDDIITEARQAGQHKVAMDGAIFIAEAFGYRDHPTLTHDHVRNAKVKIGEGQGDGEGEQAPLEGGANVTRFADAVKKYGPAKAKA